MHKSYSLKHLKTIYFKIVTKPKAETYVFFLFMLSNLLLLTKFLGGSAWLMIGYLLLLTFAIYLKLQDLIYSFFLVLIYSLQFYTPNKYYSVLVFKPFEIAPIYQGYLLAYGLNIKNIFLTITILLSLKGIVSKKNKFTKEGTKILIFTFLSGLIYFLISLYASLRYSPHFDLSLVWLIQHIMMYFMAFLILYMYTFKEKLFYLINTAIFSTLFLQSTVGIMEYIKQSSIGLPIENAHFIGALNFGASDGVISIVRAMGTFAHPNQLALIMTVLMVMVLPITLSKKNIFNLSILVISITTILLTQSRSGWLSLLAVVLLAGSMYQKELMGIVSLFGVVRLNVILTIVILVTSFAVIPRMIKIFNVFDAGSSVPVRLEMIKEGAMAFSLNPWIGYGIGTNEPVLFRLFPNGYIYNFPAPIHNAYVQMLLESGVIGLLSFILPFIYVIRQMINKYLVATNSQRKNEKDFFFITLAGLLSFGVYYLLQPHEGFREFYYLGIILGYGIISVSKVVKLKAQR